MVELAVRITFISLLMAFSGVTGKPNFDFAWRLGTLCAAYSFVIYQLDRKGLRNSGIAGFVAVADAGVIAILAAAAGHIESFGFMVLVPCAYATSRFTSNPAAMAPLAAGWLLVAHNFLVETEPSPALLIQAVAVLSIGLLLRYAQPRTVGSVETFVQPVALSAEPSMESDELRTKYRVLREQYREIELKSKRDRIVASLANFASLSTAQFHQQIAKRFSDLIQAEGVCLYTVAQFDGRMVVAGSFGRLPQALQAQSFEIDYGLSDGQIRHRIDQSIDVLLSHESRRAVRSVLLRHEGRIVGMACVTHMNSTRLDEAVELAEVAAPFLSGILEQQRCTFAAARKLRECELLYRIASTCLGADSPASLAARVVREIAQIVECDHCAIWCFDGKEALPLSSSGAPIRLIESMSFANGLGIDGWRALGSPEILLFDAAADPQCPRVETVKARVGSYCILPVQFEENSYGFVSVATHRTGGLDVDEMEALRVIAAEFSQAIARMVVRSDKNGGLATPSEFHHAVSEARGGYLVYLELLRIDDLREDFGPPAIEHALMNYARRIRAKLPLGALLCRRDDGHLVALLRGCTEAFSRSWANEAAAMASMIGMKTPDGKARIPLALRAKVAQLSSQNDQISLAEAV